MISTFQALGVAIVAIMPGATYTFAYERQAGAYGAHLADRIVRFLVASAAFHAMLAGPEFALFRHLEHTGFDHVNPWAVELAFLPYFVVPFGVGQGLGWAAANNKSWARLLVGSSRHPRAWDHLWSHNKRLIVRINLKSGLHLAGLYEPSTGGIDSYASGYGEDGDLYLSRQLIVDSETGDFEVDADGVPTFYQPSTGLLVRAGDVESWHVQEVDHG